jgi:hypothetical protein
MSKPSARMLEEAFFEFKKQAGEGLCWVKGCRNMAKPDRCLCAKHQMQRWRSKDRVTADYCNLRDHAKARNIEFSITPDYWRGITDAFGLYATGASGETLTVDRVDASRGYVVGNLRIVSLSVNAAKSNRERYLPEHVQAMLDRRRDQTQADMEKYLSLDDLSSDDVWYDDGTHEQEEEQYNYDPF